MPTLFPGHTPTSFSERLRELNIDVERIKAGNAPSAEELDQAPLLDAWAFTITPVPCLIGTVFSHPLHADRRLVRTTQVMALDVESGRWARTWSRFYRLGIPRGAFPDRGHA